MRGENRSLLEQLNRVSIQRVENEEMMEIVRRRGLPDFIGAFVSDVVFELGVGSELGFVLFYQFGIDCRNAHENGGSFRICHIDSKQVFPHDTGVKLGQHYTPYRRIQRFQLFFISERDHKLIKTLKIIL